MGLDCIIAPHTLGKTGEVMSEVQPRMISHQRTSVRSAAAVNTVALLSFSVSGLLLQLI